MSTSFRLSFYCLAHLACVVILPYQALASKKNMGVYCAGETAIHDDHVQLIFRSQHEIKYKAMIDAVEKAIKKSEDLNVHSVESRLGHHSYQGLPIFQVKNHLSEFVVVRPSSDCLLVLEGEESANMPRQHEYMLARKFRHDEQNIAVITGLLSLDPEMEVTPLTAEAHRWVAHINLNAADFTE